MLKYRNCLIVLLLLLFESLCATSQNLEQYFLNPPPSAKPHTWWHWMNGHVSKEGITADLEAMAEIGIGGVQAFHVSNSIPKGPVDYMSDEWLDLMQHAIQEANRLGLEFCFHNTPGWSSSGGKWITPELSMKKIVFSEIQLEGQTMFNFDLQQPESYNGYYEDIAILAFPTPKSEFNNQQGYRLSDWQKKAGFADFINVKNSSDPLSEQDIISLEKVIDISHLETWLVPEGKWTVVRFGYTSTGVTNRQSPPEVLGLECDKLSPEAVKYHWDNTVGKVIKRAGGLAGATFNNVLIDSYEVKYQNWTKGFETYFKQNQHYDLLSYLPCVTGRAVGSVDISERFLWDFRRTIADLFVEAYIGTFSELCRQHGMVLSSEPYGPGNFNHIEVGVKSDIPMGEFWNNSPDRYAWTNKLAASAAHINNTSLVGAEAFTSSPPNAWDNYPSHLKTQGDWAFTQGINRFIFHTFAHQPRLDIKPGMTMGPHGMMGNRNATWWNHGNAWMEYLARCQYLLQQGTAVIDFAYVVSEDAPFGNALQTRDGFAFKIPRGYDYDIVNAGSVMNMEVNNGHIKLPGGTTYRVLILDEQKAMRSELAQKINDLIKAGASVVGKRLNTSAGLTTTANADEKVKELCAIIPKITVEHTLNNIQVKPDVILEMTDAAAGEEVLPLEYIHRKTADSDIYFISNQNEFPVHVKGTFRVEGKQPELWNPVTGEMAELAQFSSTKDKRTTVSFNLESTGSSFIIFRKTASNKGVKGVTLNGVAQLGINLNYKNGKLILQTYKPGLYEVTTNSGEKLTTTVESVPSIIELNRGWKLSFPDGWGAMPNVQMDSLHSWSEFEHYDTKHFSGTATYSIGFEMEPNMIENLIANGLIVQLNLGRVEVIADVKLNNKKVGTVWNKPFCIDITDYLKSGTNYLEIQVANLWINRLIGDEIYPDIAEFTNSGTRGAGMRKTPDWLMNGDKMPESERKTFVTWKYYTKDSTLWDSGLIGPVRIISQKKAVLTNCKQTYKL